MNNWGNLIITNQASAAIRTDGIDLTANYELPTDTLGKFTLMANANLTLNFEVQSDPSQPYQHYEGLWTANFGTAQGLIPDYRLNFGLSWDFRRCFLMIRTPSINTRCFFGNTCRIFPLDPRKFPETTSTLSPFFT